jgi:hypothetical protein
MMIGRMSHEFVWGISFEIWGRERNIQATIFCISDYVG